MKSKRSLCLALILALPWPAKAGVFGGTANCSAIADCEPLAFVSDPANSVPPFAITHPPGYDGSGGQLQYRICLGTGSESLEGPLRRAIDTWNALVPTTSNCTGCKVWEEEETALVTAHAETVLLHELGHCPMGLDHPDRNWDPQNDGIWEFTSFTRSWDVARPPDGIKVGPDFIRGTLDDIQTKGAGMIPESVHWFRVADNNPFVIDDTVIDKNTFSRSIVQDLPVGHSWAANANRRVGEDLGVPNTQAVMYGLYSEGERKTSLTADDVAMVQMGMTGRDQIAGTTDDYTIELVLVDPCEDPVDILVLFGTPPGVDSVAACQAGYDFSFPQNPFLAFHVTLQPPDPTLPFLIILNDQLIWDLGETVFTSGFETGDFSDWDSAASQRLRSDPAMLSRSGNDL